MDEVAYTLPPRMRDLARIWHTEESAIRAHLLDVNLSNPFTPNAKHKLTHISYPNRISRYTDTGPIHTCLSDEIPFPSKEYDMTQIPAEIPTQEPAFLTSQEIETDSFTQLLMEAELAIQTMDCYNPTPFDSNNIPMHFPKVGMGYQEDTIESSVRASTGEPPLVTLRPYERHWKRSGVYQWRKPASLGTKGIRLEDKSKQKHKRNKIVKNNTTSKEKVKKALVVSLNSYNVIILLLT